MRIKISHGDSEGFVTYNEKEQEILVDFEDALVQEEVDTYLHTQRSFTIPESNVVDDFRRDFVYPYENLTYFELAMSELHAHTDVWVHW